MAAPEQPLPLSRGCLSSALSPPRGDRTLLVRHLPAELTAEEKEDLLKYFGAQSVRVLSDKGRLVSVPSSPGVPGPPGEQALVSGQRAQWRWVPGAALACWIPTSSQNPGNENSFGVVPPWTSFSDRTTLLNLACLR